MAVTLSMNWAQLLRPMAELMMAVSILLAWGTGNSQCPNLLIDSKSRLASHPLELVNMKTNAVDLDSLCQVISRTAAV